MAAQNYDDYESPETKFEKRLRAQLGAAKGANLADAITEFVKAIQQDTIDRINKTGEWSPDY